MEKMVEFIIDKITNSIEEVATGKIFETEMILINSQEIKTVFKKDGWSFNWKKEFENSRHEIYKLVVEGDEKIQGLVSIEPISDQFYIEMHLIENAPHNYAANRQFVGVAGNMIAFTCKKSFDLGFGGFVAFTAKTNLVNHYSETLGAKVIYNNNRMGIFTPAAKILVNSYYKNYFRGR